MALKLEASCCLLIYYKQRSIGIHVVCSGPMPTLNSASKMAFLGIIAIANATWTPGMYNSLGEKLPNYLLFDR